MKTLIETITEEQRFLNRQVQMAKAERAKRILRAIDWAIQELQFLPNGEEMTNKLFRMVLKSNEDMKQRFDILWNRKQKIERVIYNNA